ncbi:divergent polysaccharide deacetylase family protein [Paenibacillus antibioticophila]|uniref:divergent polysaccharide deacetylase family protein n=1 Tax=Paenibacillus antibioticophila TaxID=1274374 RepID=UPI0005C8999C|nr:divergent polysaccharide deacetylase family protein [Paenibacillus antibioticophila]
MNKSGYKSTFCRLLSLSVILTVSLLCSGGAASFAANQEEGQAEEPRIAIIIDDFGNDMGGSDEMLQLGIPMTVAVMPFLPTTAEDAERAHQQGYDVLVHLPLEPKHGKPEWLGPGAIMASMSDEEVRSKVEAAVANVPHAVGINNHMGSKITGDKRVMGIILDVCREQGLFFVDSKTNYRSVVDELCRERGLPVLENSIFLDDVSSTGHVTAQLRKAEQLAREQNSCITIGHVGIRGKITSAALKKAIPDLKADGVQFIRISDLAMEQMRSGIKSGPGFTLP